MPADFAQEVDASQAGRNRELAARLYLTKVNEYARQYAARLGPAYGAKEVDWNKLVELWETKNPDVDVNRAWEDAAAQAEKLIAADPTIDPDLVRKEIPIEVARRVYPKREEAIKSAGGQTYKEWADLADEIEKRAAKLRPAEPEVSAATKEPVGPPMDMALVTPEPMQAESVDGQGPVAEMSPQGALGPDAAPPSELPGVSGVDPLQNRMPGTL